MIQCFVKKNVTSSFNYVTFPKLLYVSKIKEESSIYPRVMHSHDDFVEIVLICKGSGEYSIGGKMYNIKPGDVLIYNSGVIHDEISGPNIKIASYCCAISGIKVEKLRKNALIPDDECPVVPSKNKFPVLYKIFNVMFSTLSSGCYGAEESCNYLMMALLVQVKNLLCKIAGFHDGNTDEPNVLVRRIEKYINQHYKEDMSLKTMSGDLNISPYYLSHIFKNFTSYSPIQYVLRRRIGEAQTLLITTNYSVTQIASIVGYDNPSNFNLIFTKYVGMSPKKYRKNYIVKVDNIKKSFTLN
ncbi:AraC family transcriptional regulator [Clostridium tyrobutyricum]|uniref:AraC family transcriptional regulator n=1 Tax=Clostridium tyrobutyricum TaxID=1519 RepID=UPI001C38B870|nr:AraC family transcriptional regulator [Clostridium tyrobutyricum]MBV4422268.1 AraC family transcriptional regulator [Clostridium tyrobutyricum]MBV4439084.1 AraC family transcriptional regulator [Clostridium tyrobutyricum]MBV4446212.1 AraC family transcriptional regulator [Clostridium tyrobutyricum]